MASFAIFDKYRISNCIIVLLEAYPSNSKYKLHARDDHYIRSMQCVNKNIPGRTKKMYRDENKDAVR